MITLPTVAFTGTRQGMTLAQVQTVGQLCAKLNTKFGTVASHHGACHGADRQFHVIAREMGWRIDLWPSNNDQQEWAASQSMWAVIHDISPPLTRNDSMIQLSDVAIAAPSGFFELQRGSGTWATFRYMFKKGGPTFVCYPDGTFEVVHHIKGLPHGTHNSTPIR